MDSHFKFFCSVRWINTFTDVAGYICYETFGFMMSLLAMSFGNRFCMSRMGGKRGGPSG